MMMLPEVESATTKRPRRASGSQLASWPPRVDRGDRRSAVGRGERHRCSRWVLLLAAAPNLHH